MVLILKMLPNITIRRLENEHLTQNWNIYLFFIIIIIKLAGFIGPWATMS